MIDIILTIIILLLLALFVVCQLFFSKISKSTKELVRLNKLWDRFNDGEDREEIREEINKKNWKYYEQNALLLIDLINLTNRMEQNGNKKRNN